jgi:hypothetical protein
MAKDPTKPQRKATSTTRKGNGRGWGGEARGSGGDKPALEKFKKFNREAVGRAPPDKERVEWRRQKAWEMENLLDHYAEHGETEMVRERAAERLHAICDGMPVSRTELTGKDGGPLQAVSVTAEEFREIAKAIAEDV